MTVPRRTMGPWAWGFVVSALYVLVAAVSFGGSLPVRPLYDGPHVPIPYRWMRPPAGLEEGNVPPAGADTSLAVAENGSEAGVLTTTDGQFTLVFPEGTFDAGTGESVEVRVEPLDARSLAPPPADRDFDSNAYRVEATADGAAVELATPAIVVVRYARAADELTELQDGRWEPIPSQAFPAGLQLTAEPAAFGTFAAIGDAEELQGFLPHDGGTPTWVYLLAGTGLVLALAGARWARIHYPGRARKRHRAATRRAPGRSGGKRPRGKNRRGSPVPVIEPPDDRDDRRGRSS